MTIEERFWSKVNKTDSCWLWLGFKYKSRGGYGGFRLPNGHIKAHRYSYILHYGNIDSEKVLMHICDNPSCVRPDHLMIGTHKENMKDMVNKSRQAKGSKQGLAKLKEEDVILIKKDLENFERGMLTILSKKYNVSIQTIHSIKSDKTWKHI